MQSGAYGKPQWENHNAELWNSVARSCHPLQRIMNLLRKFLAWPWALVDTPSVQKTNNVLILLKSNFELADSLKGSWRPPNIQRPHCLNGSLGFGTKDFLFYSLSPPSPSPLSSFSFSSFFLKSVFSNFLCNQHVTYDIFKI